MRRAFQLLLLALFIYLIAQTKWPPSDTMLVDAFLSIDPLLSLQAVLASRSWVTTGAYGLMMLALALVLGRFFCGWMCPMGTCLELGDDLVYGKKKTRIWKNRQRKARGVKYIVLLVIFVGALLGQGLAYLADPICWLTRVMIYALWPMLTAFQTVLLDLFRPVFEGAGWMNLARADVDQPVFGPMGFLALGFIVVMIWLGRYQRRFWCRVLCPLGALLAVPGRIALFHRRVSDACDDEGICSKVCETGAIGDHFVQYDPGECIQCGRCVSDCPTRATQFTPTFSRQGRAPSFDLRRRTVLAGLGLAVPLSAWLAFNPHRALLAEEALRPPGAIPESDFLATCVRCGQCAKACPTNCLQPTVLQTGISGFMTPITAMRLGACDQNCNACCEVCPTDAIRSLDLDEKPYAKIGNAVIQPGKCIVWEQGKVCLVCDEHCPYGAIYWKESGEGGRKPFVDENKCNGCGQCEQSCPIEGASAIRIFPAGQIRLSTGSYRKTASQRGLVLKAKESEGGYY